MKQLAVIDFETTGNRAGRDRIIEVAAVILSDGVVTATFSELMNQGCRIPSYIADLTGISDAMVRDKPRPESVMPVLRSFLADYICLAHNASFDQPFLKAEMERAEIEDNRTFVCSLLLSRRLVQQAQNYQLESLIQHLRLAVPSSMRAHRALADVLMTCELWKHLFRILKKRIGRETVDLDVIKAVTTMPKTAVDDYIESIALS